MQKIDAELSHINFSTAYQMFKFSIRSDVTLKYYKRRIIRFFDFIEFNIGSDIEQRCNDFTEKAQSDSNWALNKIIAFLQYQRERTERGEITPATLSNFVKALKLFCEVSDVTVPWKKISRGLPRPSQSANVRAPTIDEIRKLIEYPDRRIKPIIYTMASSAMRIGAWNSLQWKHIFPIYDEIGQVLAAKMIVYAGDAEEYFCFITPEAYSSIKEWMDFRASYGEEINGSSWVMRDVWQTTNVNYGAKWGLAAYPKKLKSNGIKRIIERALWEQGIRTKLKPGVKRHEWKAAHGFRVFYKSRTEQVMRPINVEITMGYNIGLSASYYKPTEKEVLEDYLKAVDLLTISNASNKLEKEISELKEKNRDNEYIIRGKLEEKENEIKNIKENESYNADAIEVLSYRLTKALEDIEELKQKVS